MKRNQGLQHQELQHVLKERNLRGPLLYTGTDIYSNYFWCGQILAHFVLSNLKFSPILIDCVPFKDFQYSLLISRQLKSFSKKKFWNNLAPINLRALSTRIQKFGTNFITIRAKRFHAKMRENWFTTGCKKSCLFTLPGLTQDSFVV